MTFLSSLRMTAACALVLVFPSVAAPLETARSMPPDFWSAIMEEATQRSRVLDMPVELSDVRGPRLLGTWSGSTPMPLTGIPLAVDFDVLDDPDTLAKYEAELRNRLLLLQPVTTSGPAFGSSAERWRAHELARASRSKHPAPLPGIYFTPRESFQRALDERLARVQREREVQLYLTEQGVAAVLLLSRFTHGLLYLGATPLIHAGDPDPVPQVVIGMH